MKEKTQYMTRTCLSILLGVLLLACSSCAITGTNRSPAAGAPEAKPLRVYLIGNSLTYNVFQNPDTTSFMNERGHRFDYGMDISWGSPLWRLWAQPTTGTATTEPFGYYAQALTQYQWDAITLQPYSSQLDGEKGDIAAAVRFIEYARKKSPDAQFYIYQDWPSKDKEGFDFSAKWLRECTDGKSGWGLHSRDYCEKLLRGIREAVPDLKKPLLVIPGGDLLCELDRRMKAGQVPGYHDVGELYVDNIHFNAVGDYAVRCVFYATLYGEDPRGLPATVAGQTVVSDELAAIFQDAAWTVVGKMKGEVRRVKGKSDR